MSVDDILRRAIVRRENEDTHPQENTPTQSTNPIESDLRSSSYDNARHYSQDIYYDQTPPAYPELVQSNQENIDDLIERKVEQYVRKMIGNSELSSIHGSREGSIPRASSTTDAYWQTQNAYNTIPANYGVPNMYDRRQLDNDNMVHMK
jgi:hypothetical protein